MDTQLMPYTKHTALVNYIPIPRSLLGSDLPVSALLIYGILLDRCMLSKKNGMFCTDGQIYAVFPVLELTQLLHLSPTTVKDHLKLLEDRGLIRRERLKRREANRIYPLVPSDCVTAGGRAGKLSPQSRKNPIQRDGKLAPSYLKELPDLANAYHSGEGSL